MAGAAVEVSVASMVKELQVSCFRLCFEVRMVSVVIIVSVVSIVINVSVVKELEVQVVL